MMDTLSFKIKVIVNCIFYVRSHNVCVIVTSKLVSEIIQKKY